MKMNRKGFALIEVVISVAISCIMLIVILSCQALLKDTAVKEKIIYSASAFINEAIFELFSDVKGSDELDTIGETTLEITKDDKGILYEIANKTLFRNGQQLLQVEYGSFLLDGDFIEITLKPKDIQAISLKLRRTK